MFEQWIDPNHFFLKFIPPQNREL